LIFKEYIKDVGYRPVFSGGELRDRGINPKSTGKGFLYTWNANGSLRSVTDLKGVTYRFRYDAFGRRLEKRRMASTFRFVWDGNVLLHETFKKDNSENTELTTWVFEGFVPTAKLVNGKAYSIISDHLGTPILAIDSEGNEVWNRQLDIYGRVKREIKASSLGDDVRPFIPFLYQGQYYDFETNLAYNRYRYYSPESGMYISQDPIKLNGNNPNIYAYVEDSNWWIDVFGLAKCRLSKKDREKVKKTYPDENVEGGRPHFHHIVREKIPESWDKEHQEYVRKSQEILEKNGIDLNKDIRNFTRAANGNGAHTKEAAKYVYEQLTSSTNVEETLKKLAEKMNNNQFTK